MSETKKFPIHYFRGARTITVRRHYVEDSVNKIDAIIHKEFKVKQ